MDNLKLVNKNSNLNSNSDTNTNNDTIKYTSEDRFCDTWIESYIDTELEEPKSMILKEVESKVLHKHHYLSRFIVTDKFLEVLEKRKKCANYNDEIRKADLDFLTICLDYNKFVLEALENLPSNPNSEIYSNGLNDINELEMYYMYSKSNYEKIHKLVLDHSEMLI